jgi:integrase
MSIYRRADGRWVGSLDLGHDANGKRQRHVVYGKLRREVVAKLDEARDRLAADQPVKDARTTVASFINDWLEKALPASGRRPTTQELYSSLARTHLTAKPLGELPLDRLRPSDIEALLLAKRDAGLAGWTVRAVYTVCRQAMDTAVRDGLIRRNPAAAVKRPTVERSEARYLTPEEAGRLLEAAKGDRLYPLLVVLLGTGLRRGEALALHWSDVDLTAGHMRVRWSLARVSGKLVFSQPKTEKSRRFVSLPAPVLETLRRHRVAQAAEQLATPVWHPWPDHPDLVFSTQFGTPIEPRNAARSFTRIAGRAGLDGASLHTLRHSAASALIASGVHVRIVQEVLGHSTYTVTADTYAHIAVAQQREAAERLGEAFPW